MSSGCWRVRTARQAGAPALRGVERTAPEGVRRTERLFRLEGDVGDAEPLAEQADQVAQDVVPGAPAGHLDGDVVALDPGQLDLDQVGVVGLLQVGQGRKAAAECGKVTAALDEGMRGPTSPPPSATDHSLPVGRIASQLVAVL